MIDFALDAGFYIFIATGVFAVLFLIIRFCTISSWTLVVKVTQIDTYFRVAQSWATMLSPFISVLGIALPLISGASNENGDELQSLNFFYGIIFLISAIFYMASSSSSCFLVCRCSCSLEDFWYKCNFMLGGLRFALVSFLCKVAHPYLLTYWTALFSLLFLDFNEIQCGRFKKQNLGQDRST